MSLFTMLWIIGLIPYSIFAYYIAKYIANLFTPEYIKIYEQMKKRL